MKKFKPLEILGKNGWEWVAPGSKEIILDDYTTYKAVFLGKAYKSTIYAVVAQYKKDLEVNGHYGIMWLEASFEYKQPAFTWNDLEDMEEALISAEDNLLCIGMPFCKTYRFHGNRKEIFKTRNEVLRASYNLDELEEEALSMEGGKKE